VFVANTPAGELRELAPLHRDRSKPLPPELGFALRMSSVLAGSGDADTNAYLDRLASAFGRAVERARELPPAAVVSDGRLAGLVSVLESVRDAVEAHARDAGVATEEPSDDFTPGRANSEFARGFMDVIHKESDRLAA
jgi:hypothetical protein